ncbi:FAD-dependent monooxygenase [Streptomyces albidus (ex Kaewkla and Franco 2022)]|uniref:FAD-dependent monooxygenase n=1 Tax=Streptomyces albidus (ex Kaewkla and Franco 2022) TaxID=722709 RepID=UPI0015EE72BF|nr:FAD-dependent monooxygenase [Streptomyces albidus (ex Kaewkla and Franco 2022)]
MSKFIVAGGGIGGLATALSIARRGHRVEVLERNEEFAELGAGIQLAANAFSALSLLGVGAQVERTAVHVDELTLWDGLSGRPLATMPAGETYRRRFGNPYAVAHRGDLYAALLQACREHEGVRLLGGRTVVGYENRPGSVTCHLSSGGRITGDGLIGADGIRSAVRRQLLDDGEPQVSGHTIYRAVVPMEGVPHELRWNTVSLWAGPDWHFVHYPIAGGRLLNLAVTCDDGATEAVAGAPVPEEQVRGRFPGLCETPRRLLELGRDWRTWVLCDRGPAPRWTEGRVVLMGDAAHPMLQYAAQGACTALEDAVALGTLLDGCPEDRIPERFERFHSVRHTRTAKVQQVSRWMGEALYHPSGAEAEARNAMLAALGPEELFDAVSWVHSAPLDDVPEPTPALAEPTALS